MITLQECLDFSELDEDAVDEIAEHEHVSPIVAAEIGAKLLDTPRGVLTIKHWLLDNLEHAKLNGQQQRARHIDEVYRRFSREHPTPRVL